MDNKKKELIQKSNTIITNTNNGYPIDINNHNSYGIKYTRGYYNDIKKLELKNKLDILNVVFNLNIEEYNIYLNLIDSDDEANLEIATGLLANLHNNYNITKK